MNACTHRYDDNPTGLICTRTDAHDPERRGGHTYTSSSGSELGEGLGHHEPREDAQ